jgi:hypothetical protein
MTTGGGLGAYGSRRLSFRNRIPQAIEQQRNRLDDTPVLPVIVTEVQLDLIPSEYILADGEPLGKEDYPVKYVIDIANDDRIIGVQRLGHPWFTYDVAQYNESEDDYIGTSLPYTLHHIQEAITWFYNSRFSNVRKVIGNKLIVDPSAVHMQDFENRSPIIKIKATHRNQDIRTFVHQLALTDVTVNHVQDAQILRGIAKEATGISDNLIGQFSSGRRSAQEAANVNQNALSRIKIHIDALWHSSLRTLADKMIYNHRVFLDVPTVVKVEGLRAFDPQTGQPLPEIQQMTTITKEQVIGSYDIKVYDGTLPSEKAFIAQQQAQILPLTLQNPEMFIQLTSIDPRLLWKDYLRNLGMRNIESLFMGVEQLNQYMAAIISQQQRIQNEKQAGASNNPSRTSSNEGTQSNNEGPKGVDNALAPLLGSLGIGIPTL